MRWTVLIPVKALPAAKSRLAAASADAAAHARLVYAIRADTIASIAEVPDVARIVVVVDRPTALDHQGELIVVVQREPGLNAGLREAARDARQSWPADGVAALVADLPALRPGELAAALAQAAAHGRAFVPDTAGTGTTMLTAAPQVQLEPAFGLDSAARHAVGAVTLDAGPGLRRDVDTAQDLDAAAELGVNAHTAAELQAAADTRSSTGRGMMHDMSDAYGPEA